MSAFAQKQTLASVLFEAILSRSCDVNFWAEADINYILTLKAFHTLS